MKKLIFEWLFNLNYKYILNKRNAKMFAQNYLEDIEGYKYIKEIYKNTESKKKFENICIKSFKLQNNIKSTYEKKMKNYKNKYCCKNFYHGNKKYCDYCKQSLKY